MIARIGARQTEVEGGKALTDDGGVERGLRAQQELATADKWVRCAEG